MLFNPDPHKPAQEVLIKKKKKVSIHPVISQNNIHVEKAYLIKNIFVYSLMKNPLLNIIWTIRFAKLLKV